MWGQQDSSPPGPLQLWSGSIRNASPHPFAKTLLADPQLAVSPFGKVIA